MSCMKAPSTSLTASFAVNTLGPFHKEPANQANTSMNQPTTTVPPNRGFRLNPCHNGTNNRFLNATNIGSHRVLPFWNHIIPYSELSWVFLRLFIAAITQNVPQTALKYLRFNSAQLFFTTQTDWHTSCNYSCSYPRNLLRLHIAITRLRA